MNAETLLSSVTHAAFLFIFSAVLMDAIRTPRRMAGNAMLFFAALTEDVAQSVTSGHHSIAVEDDRLIASVDGERIRQVMQNMVDNAVKFSPAGGTIVICCEQRDDGVALAVTDHGIGFRRGICRISSSGSIGEDALASVASLGMGIGLFLCKRIVEEHGGTISVDSVHGQGTRFLVTLPLARSEQRRANAAAHSGS